MPRSTTTTSWASSSSMSRLASAPVRYGTRFGCRFGQPHDFQFVGENKAIKVEVCAICRARRRWQKDAKGRVDNVNYLRDHVRQYAQPSGSTKRVFMKLHEPEQCIITIK